MTTLRLDGKPPAFLSDHFSCTDSQQQRIQKRCETLEAVVMPLSLHSTHPALLSDHSGCTDGRQPCILKRCEPLEAIVMPLSLDGTRLATWHLVTFLRVHACDYPRYEFKGRQATLEEAQEDGERSEPEAQHPVLPVQRDSFEDLPSKLDAQDLHHAAEYYDPQKDRIGADPVEHVELVVDLACVDLVELQETTKSITHDCNAVEYLRAVCIRNKQENRHNRRDGTSHSGTTQ